MASLAKCSVCPACGRKMAVPRAPAAVDRHVETSTLSDKALYAYYKRIAHIEDVRFLLEHARLSVDVAQRATVLLVRAEAGLSRTETLQALHLLQCDWRRQQNAIELEAHRAAGDRYDGKSGIWYSAEEYARIFEAIAEDQAIAV